MNTPASQGHAMPPEWAPHARTWMMWPCRAEVWDDMEATRRSYAGVAHAIRRHEPLTMLVRPQDMSGARALLGSDIDLLECPIDDSWCRDAGPCFVTRADGTKAGVDFRFNAWGEKYAPFDGDARAARAILAAAGVPVLDSPLIAEGGGINVDGRGTILTTETCFPNTNRNPDWSREEIEAELMRTLGGTKVIWLPGSELEVETNGHVDGIAAFVAPGLVLMEGPAGDGSDWDRTSAANITAMQGQTDATGAPIRIRTVPPGSVDHDKYEMFCSSYVNSYICNGAVIMPEFGMPEDDLAAEMFREFFPDRTIERVNIDAIAIGGGGIHCITQQEPA